MAHFQIKRGLDIPITGNPGSVVNNAPQVSHVGVLAEDYVGLKPIFNVSVGDFVALGQTLFTDRRDSSVSFTSPGSGTVVAISRGEKRKFLSIEIELSGEEVIDFGSTDIGAVDSHIVSDKLQKSGLWTAFKTRPFGKVPFSKSTPTAIFITAMDTRPLAADPEIIILSQLNEFHIGLKAISTLAPEVHVCVKQYSDLSLDLSENTVLHTFEGPHPSGLVGTHMHMVRPVHRGIEHWHVDYQDVIAIGHLFLTGKVSVDRVISLGGPSIKEPSLIKTRLGASVIELVDEYIDIQQHRVISGSVLYGYQAKGCEAYLGRYHQQISVLPEGNQRHFMGWAAPGKHRFSLTNVFLSRLFGDKDLVFNTSTNGSHRPIIPIGVYEKVMPMDLMMTHLLRSISIADVEDAERLGVLELDEEDLALSTYVCPGKNDFVPMLRNVLDIIEKEG